MILCAFVTCVYQAHDGVQEDRTQCWNCKPNNKAIILRSPGYATLFLGFCIQICLCRCHAVQLRSTPWTQLLGTFSS